MFVRRAFLKRFIEPEKETVCFNVMLRISPGATATVTWPTFQNNHSADSDYSFTQWSERDQSSIFWISFGREGRDSSVWEGQPSILCQTDWKLSTNWTGSMSLFFSFLDYHLVRNNHKLFNSSAAVLPRLSDRKGRLYDSGICSEGSEIGNRHSSGTRVCERDNLEISLFVS